MLFQQYKEKICSLKQNTSHRGLNKDKHTPADLNTEENYVSWICYKLLGTKLPHKGKVSRLSGAATAHSPHDGKEERNVGGSGLVRPELLNSH